MILTCGVANTQTLIVQGHLCPGFLFFSGSVEPQQHLTAINLQELTGYPFDNRRAYYRPTQLGVSYIFYERGVPKVSATLMKSETPLLLMLRVDEIPRGDEVTLGELEVGDLCENSAYRYDPGVLSKGACTVTYKGESVTTLRRTSGGKEEQSLYTNNTKVHRIPLGYVLGDFLLTLSLPFEDFERPLWVPGSAPSLWEHLSEET